MFGAGGASVISAVSSGYGPLCLEARLELKSCTVEKEGEETPGRMEEARPEAWPVAQGYGLELVAFHRSFRLLENVLALILIHLRNDACILLLDPKVVLDQVKGLLVYLLVLVALQELNLVQACVGTSLKQSYKHMNKQHDKHSLHERKAYDNSDNNNKIKKNSISKINNFYNNNDVIFN